MRINCEYMEPIIYSSSANITQKVAKRDLYEYIYYDPSGFKQYHMIATSFEIPTGIDGSAKFTFTGEVLDLDIYAVDDIEWITSPTGVVSNVYHTPFAGCPVINITSDGSLKEHEVDITDLVKFMSQNNLSTIMFYSSFVGSSQRIYYPSDTVNMHIDEGVVEPQGKPAFTNINGAIKHLTKAQANINGNIVNLKKAQTNINGVIKTIWSYGDIAVPLPVMTGLYTHFDASDISSVNIENGKIVQWSDKSGNNNHATPPQAQYAPTYENGMIKFNNAHALEFNQLNLQTGGTVFFVANVASGKPAAHQIISNNLGVNAQLRVEATNGQFRLVGSPSIGGGGSDFGYDVLNQAGARFTPTTGQTFNYNSFGTIGTPASTTIPVNQIGARVLTGSEFLIGSIAEIIIYDRVLTDGEVGLVNDYLHYKWIESPLTWDGNYRNLALEGTATASSENQTTENASLAIDGDTTSAGSRWISASTDTNIWLEVNLGKLCKIDKIDVYTGNRYPDVVSIVSTYTLQVNKDGVWVDTVEITGNTEYHRSHAFTATITDKVRMIFPNQTGYQRIYELEIYGEGGTAK